MRNSLTLGVLMAFCLGACSPADDSVTPVAENQASGPGEWVTLFDGSDLARWNVIGDANWRITNDYVEADSGNGFLVSDLEYDDFELTLEFWVTLEANSGVFIRCQDPQQIGADNCYEVNIFDTRPDQTYRSGSIVNFAAPSSTVNTGGRWNEFHIVADGARLQVTLNGVTTVDIEDETYAGGPFALQYGAGTVIFRNVRARTL